VKPLIPEWLERLLRRPVAVFGGGVSGTSAANLVRRLGGTAVIYDQASADPAENRFGSAEATRHPLVVVSPGFAPGHEWLQAAHSAGCEVLAEIDFGALAWPGSVVAVTGTNGKTTITEFLASALRLTGRDAHAAGNIGMPLCETAAAGTVEESSIAVCEVSSFQAESLRFLEADTTIWSNFAEDHLDRHVTAEAYFRAKYNLVKRTRHRRVIYGENVGVYARAWGCELPVDGSVSFGDRALPSRVSRTALGREPQSNNFRLVDAVWRAWDLPEDVLVAAAETFRVAPHRLARVGEVREVSFWNDSKATNFHATEAAVSGFAQPVIWIGGGHSKGGDLDAFVQRIAPHVRHAFVFGETGDLIASRFNPSQTSAQNCGSLREAIVQSLEAARPGENVVFSPGFSSFDMFKNYVDRGRQFEALVAELSADSRPSSPSTIKSSLNRSANAGLCPL